MSSNGTTGYVVAWPHAFLEGAPCSFCGTSDRVILARSELPPGEEPRGICEACAVNVHWIWRKLSGDAVPVADSWKVRWVKVFVPQLGMVEGERAPSEHPASYKIMVNLRGDGDSCDLPTVELGDGEPEKDAVVRALRDLGALTWHRCVEPLYAAHTLRGSVARIYLVTAFADLPDAKSTYAWRDWPITRHASPSQAGFYSGLADVWPLRICKHRTQGSRTEDVTTKLRKGAVEYIRMQLDLLKSPDADTSMAEYLRKSMTDDEKLVCKQIVSDARLDLEKKAEEVEAAQTKDPAGEEYVEKTGEDLDEVTSDESSESPAETLDDAFAEGADE